MKNTALLPIILILISISLFSQSSSKKDDKTLSPYFMVKSDDNSVEGFPLMSTSADVKIYGVIADVTVKQVYRNGGTKPLEAVYVFPASTRAAVYAMTMKIQNRLLIAEIHKKEEARKIYEDAKKEGKSTSLLEQDRPNIFTMNVANIMPGDTITVEMRYTELLVPNDGIYEFVYPTVVLPRYVSPESSKNEDFNDTPYTHSGEAPMYDFNINTEILAGLPNNEIKSKSHKINIEYTDENHFNANILMDEGQKKSGNKDFILNYSLTGNKIQTGLLLSKNGAENFFLLMLQPPKKIEAEQIPPRDYIFILDVSGSMNGYPLDISKKVIKKLLSNLNPYDYFNIMFFSGSSELLSEKSIPATSYNIDKAMKLINGQIGGGGTEILPALRKVYSVPKTMGLSRSIVIMTDGGISVEEEVFNLINENLSQANVFAFGIGTSVNRYLMEGMARVGRGEPFIATTSDEADEVSQKFLKYIESPVLTDVKVKFNDFKAYDFEPEAIPDVMEQRPIILFGKWKGESKGTITVSGIFNKQELHVDLPLKIFATEDTSSALKYLWARSVISRLSDYNTVGLYNYNTNSNKSSRNEKITQLGLDYNLLTQFTSFVAVDYEIRNEGVKTVKVKQPNPLPEGVSDLAIGGNLSGTYPNALGGFVNSGYTGGYGGGEDDPLCPNITKYVIYLGPNFGAVGTFHSGFPVKMDSLSPGSINQNTFGDGYYFGFSYYQFLGSNINSRHSVIFNLNYKVSNRINSQVLKDSGYINKMVQQGNNSITSFNYDNEFRISTLNLSILYDFNIVGGLCLDFGFDFDLKLSDNFKEKISLDKNSSNIFKPNPKIISFEDNNKTAVLYNDNIKGMKSFNFGLLFGIRYEIITGTKIDIIPYIDYNLSLTKWLNNWKTDNIYMGVHFRFAI